MTERDLVGRRMVLGFGTDGAKETVTQLKSVSRAILSIKHVSAGLSSSLKSLGSFNFGTQFANMERGFKDPSKIANLGTAIASVTKNMDAQLATRAKFAGDSYSKHMRSLDTNFKNVMRSAKPLPKGMQNIDEFMDRMGKSTGRTNKQFQRFDMNALGIMFFGMAIQRVFTSIIKASTEMFTKIMESSEAGATNIQILGTMFDFLKFKIGSAINNAIGPFIPKIFEIVNKVGRWISENEKLVTGIIGVGTAVGAFLFLLGTLKLGFGSLIGKISAVAGSKGFGVFLTNLPIIGVAITTAIALWTSNFGGFRDTVKDIFSGFVVFAESVAPDIGNVFKGLFDGIVGFFEGDMDKMEDGLLLFGGSIVKIFAKTMLAVAFIIIKIIEFALNIVQDLFFHIIPNLTDWLVRTVIGGFDKVASFFGIDSGIDLSAFRQFQDSQSTRPDLIDFGVNSDVLGTATEGVNTIVNQALNITVEGNADEDTVNKISEEVAGVFNDSAGTFRGNGASGTF